MTFDPDYYTALDAGAIAAYHANLDVRAASSQYKYRLQLDMGPHPFDGDPRTASVLLLLANPSFDDKDDTRFTHHTFTRPGWPFSSLHDDAAAGMRDWCRPKVRASADEFGWQHVAQRVALVQIHPWDLAQLRICGAAIDGGQCRHCPGSNGARRSSRDRAQCQLLVPSARRLRPAIAAMQATAQSNPDCGKPAAGRV